MSRRLNRTVLSLMRHETVWVCRVIHAESVADHSRHRVQRLQNCVVRRLSFLFGSGTLITLSIPKKFDRGLSRLLHTEDTGAMVWCTYLNESHTSWASWCTATCTAKLHSTWLIYAEFNCMAPASHRQACRRCGCPWIISMCGYQLRPYWGYIHEYFWIVCLCYHIRWWIKM